MDPELETYERCEAREAMRRRPFSRQPYDECSTLTGHDLLSSEEFGNEREGFTP